MHAIYRASGKPIELNPLAPTRQHPMGWQNLVEFCRESFRQGVRAHPQFTTNRPELHLKLADTFVFDEMPLWREVLTSREPERSRSRVACEAPGGVERRDVACGRVRPG